MRKAPTKGLRFKFLRGTGSRYTREFDRVILTQADRKERLVQLWIYAVQCIEIGDFWRGMIDIFPWLNRFFKFEVVRPMDDLDKISEHLLKPKAEVWRVGRRWYGLRYRRLVRRNYKPVDKNENHNRTGFWSKLFSLRQNLFHHHEEPGERPAGNAES